MRKFILIFSLIMINGCAHNNKKVYEHLHLKKILSSDHRSSENKIRDVYRHPVKTLKFLGLRPNMKVVEISPGGGWYTEILGPYLKDEGELTLAIFSDQTQKDYKRKLNQKLKEKIETQKELYGRINYTVFDLPENIGPIAEKESVDMVLTFRNTHNWMKVGKVKDAFKEFFRVLKPGGILGVVQHRNNLNTVQDPKASSGYVREDFLIKLAEEVGLEFVNKSEVNANYLDTKKYPEGVWTLPPSLKLKEKDRFKYLAIGESDRMTLKFRRPL